jgi:hypothetical protein
MGICCTQYSGDQEQSPEYRGGVEGNNAFGDWPFGALHPIRFYIEDIIENYSPGI